MKFYPFIFLLFIIACETVTHGSNSDKIKENTSQELSAIYKPIQLEGYYSLDIPKELIKTNLNDFASIQYFSVKYQFGILIQNECIQESLHGLGSLNLDLEECNLGLGYLDKYLQFQLNSLKNNIPDFSFPEVKRISVNKKDAGTFEFKGTMRDDKLSRVFTGTVIEGKSDVYYIYMFYPENKQEEYEGIKNHILESFRLNESFDNIKLCGLEEVEYDEEKEDIEDPEYRGEITEPSGTITKQKK